MKLARPQFVSYLLSELAEIGALEARRFFGGWQLCVENNQFAIVMAGTLFLRVEGAFRKELEDAGSKPFSYIKAGKRISVNKYMSAPEGALDDPTLLKALVRRVIAAV